MKLILIDRDLDFRKRFSAFLASICSEISITVLDDESPLELHGADHIIIDEKISRAVRESISMSGISFTVLTSEEKHMHGNRSDGDDTGYVYKYQSAGRILRSIPAFRGQISLSHIGGDISDNMKVLCVSGFSGGCGKTSFTMALARMLRQRSGRGVLVMSMSQLPDIYDYFSYIRSEDLPDINLLLLNYASGSIVSPSSYLIQDGTGVSCFRMPEDQVSDLSSLDTSEMGGFLDYIREWNIFAYVVIDMGSHLCERNRLMYSSADRNFMIMDDRRQHEGMEERWFRKAAEGLDPSMVCRVLNYDISEDASDGIFYEESSSESSRSFDYKLPADPDSFISMGARADISMSGAYAAGVEKILKGLNM